MLEALLALHPLKQLPHFWGSILSQYFPMIFFKKIFFYLKDKLTERERQISALSLFKCPQKPGAPTPTVLSMWVARSTGLSTSASDVY